VLVPLALLAAVLPAAEFVRVDLNGTTTPVPDELRPGFFYNNTNQSANRVFDTCRIHCNMMRDGDLAWFLMSSTSYEDAMSDIRSLRSLHQHRASKSDRFVTHIAGMPWWMSRSSNTEPIGSNWRYFNSVGPRDYAIWDSLMRDIATEIRTWGYTPYYEFWNEPDLFYWNGTEAEFIGLYRHTVNAIRSADPNARVGGVAVNYWHKGIDSNMPSVYGWIPDSLIRRHAVLSHLVDSCALSGTPLDFVTWHMFSAYPYHVDQAADFFRRQLDSAGFHDAELLMTEYNASGSLRETAVQPAMLVRFLERMAAHEVGHSIAAFQDFESGNSQEFYGGYGTLSRGGLCKPVFKALQLLNETALLGRTLPVEFETDCRLTALASRQGDRVRILLANSFLTPLNEGYDALLWNPVHHINTNDLWAEGYTWATIESTITGRYTPHGPPEMVAAFEDANDAYVWARQYYYGPRTFELQLAGLSDTARGLRVVVDDSHNNVIARYDSLLGAGWTRSAAVSYLYTNQDVTWDSIVVPDSVLELTLQPNAVIMLDLGNVQTVGVGEGVAGGGIPAEPRLPTILSGQLVLAYPAGRGDRRATALLDISGRRVMELVPGENDISRLGPGVYFVGRDGRCLGRAVVVR